MSFRIVGDDLEYEFRPFARMVAPPSVLRDCAEEAIEGCDPAAVEAENEQWRKEVDEAHAVEVTTLENRVTELEEQVADLEGELEVIEACGGLAERLADVKADAAKWRELAETYGAKLRETAAPNKPKTKKRRR